MASRYESLCAAMRQRLWRRIADKRFNHRRGILARFDEILSLYDGLFEPIEPVVERSAWASDVEAQEFCTVSAVFCASRYEKTCFLSNFIRKAVRIVGICRDIEPKQIGRLRGDAMDFGEIEREKFVDGLFIVVEVLTQCVEPWCAFSIGGNRRIDGKGIGFGHFVGIEPAPDFVMELRIGNVDRCGL